MYALKPKIVQEKSLLTTQSNFSNIVKIDLESFSRKQSNNTIELIAMKNSN